MQRNGDRAASPTAETASVEPAPAAQPPLEELITLPGPTTTSASSPEEIPVLRVAHVLALEGRRATITFRSASAPTEAVLAPEVESELCARALSDKEPVLVEVARARAPVVVGVLATRVPRVVNVKAETVIVEGEREVLLRAGRAALRLRHDGDVELVGSRISAASRGLFRLVGRILRLN